MIEQGLRKVTIAGDTLRWIDTERNINRGPSIVDHVLGYRIDLYEFTDEHGKEADGCEYVISPGGATRVIQIVQDIKTQDVPIQGNGWFLGINPDGTIEEYEFHDIDKQEASIMVSLGKGWTMVWIGGSKEFHVADVTTPPFKDEMEIGIDIDDPQLPGAFWQRYHALREE